MPSVKDLVDVLGIGAVFVAGVSVLGIAVLASLAFAGVSVGNQSWLFQMAGISGTIGAVCILLNGGRW